MYLNKVLIVGNLTRDPELKSLPNGTKVTTLSIATNRTWKDGQGNRKESVEYHNVVAFARQAELIAQYCKKGSSLYVEGRLQTRSWDAADGTKKYRTEIVLENFQFGPRPSGGAPASVAPTTASDAEVSQGEAKADLDTIEYPDEEINLEDIPF
ncbi:MAG TPA: single-stranded DNA-binding protein [Candidatus Paceibacterota bacterium]|nr:single-stranded DNA-binding protein [Candidatus Paceibacterota bacterium]